MARLERVEPYMQHCVRVTVAHPAPLPETVLLLPASYAAALPPVGHRVEVEVRDHEGDASTGGDLVRLNAVVVQERPCGEAHWEHCLSAGGNVSTVVLGRRLAADAACAVAVVNGAC